jgi:hypothetical protein
MATPGNLARLARLLPILLFSIAATSCDQYQRFGKNPDDSLGPVDPVNFPGPNLGARGDRTKAGSGSFNQIRAFAGDGEAPYFAYPVPAALLPDPRLVKALSMPPAYVFDGSKCKAPPGYDREKSRQQDELPLDQQGNIFTALPKATYMPGLASTSTYVPIVTQFSASAAAEPCQRLKSEAALKKAGPPPKTDGRLLAWLLIDPAAAVYPLGKSADTDSIGLQRWGWFNRYIVAYLDGGEIAIEPDPMTMEPRLVTQKLYYPRSMVGVTKPGPDGMPMETMTAGRIGAGYDVLQAKRGDMGSSPLCQVFTYDLGFAAKPKDDPAMLPPLPTSAAAVEEMVGTVEAPKDPMRPIRPAVPPFVFCLQVVAP